MGNGDIGKGERSPGNRKEGIWEDTRGFGGFCGGSGGSRKEMKFSREGTGSSDRKRSFR